MIEFAPFPKMARFSRDAIVTEKIDGTNAQIIFAELEEGIRDTLPVYSWLVESDGKWYAMAA